MTKYINWDLLKIEFPDLFEHTELIKSICYDQKDLFMSLINESKFNCITQVGNSNIILSDSLSIASEYGAFSIVEYLLTLDEVSPENYENYAICFAYQNNHFDIVDLLFENKRVNEIFKTFNPNEYQKIKARNISQKINKF